MRTFIILAALAAASVAEAQSQVTVVAKQRQEDSVVHFRAISRYSAETLRTIAARLTELQVKANQFQGRLIQGVKDSTMSRGEVEVLENNSFKILTEILNMKSQIAIGCSQLRANDLGVVGTLGIQLRDSAKWRVDPDAQSLTIVFEQKPFIDAVVPGSPAEKAGVRAGDAWIKANGRIITDSVRLDELMKPGSKVVLGVIRGGRAKDLGPMFVGRKESDYPADLCDGADKLDALPAQWMMEIQPTRPARMPQPFMPAMPGPQMQIFVMTTGLHYGGATLQPLNDEARAFGGVEGDGLIVTEVQPGLPAAIAGLRQFDVIRQINGDPVTSAGAFLKIVNSQRALELTVFRKGVAGAPATTRTITVGK